MAAFVEKRPGVWKGRWRTTPPRRGEQERIMATIAFIGLGNMGGGMAANLAKAGHRVLAFDLSEPALAKAVEAGCERAASALTAVSAADAVVTMLPAGKHVRAVYGAQVFGSAKAGTPLMACSPLHVASARGVSEQAKIGRAAGRERR